MYVFTKVPYLCPILIILCGVVILSTALTCTNKIIQTNHKCKLNDLSRSSLNFLYIITRKKKLRQMYPENINVDIAIDLHLYL